MQAQTKELDDLRKQRIIDFLYEMGYYIEEIEKIIDDKKLKPKEKDQRGTKFPLVFRTYNEY